METWRILARKYNYHSDRLFSGMSVVLAFDSSYLPGAVALIRSLSTNVSLPLSFKVFHPNLTDDDKRSLLDTHPDVEFFNTRKNNRSKTAKYIWWFEAFKEGFLKQFGYTLYIDVDIVVSRSIDGWLKRFEKSECLISVVNQKRPSREWRELSENHLVNTGVVLFKREFFKTESFKKLQDLVINRVIENDQPFLRSFFNEERIRLLYAPISYNTNARLAKKGAKPHIYHFVGQYKPWQKSDNPGNHGKQVLWKKLTGAFEGK